MDALGDRVSDLLSVVVAGAWQIKCKSVYLVFSLLGFEGRGASYFQNTVESVPHHIFRFVLARTKPTVLCLFIEAFDAAPEQLDTASARMVLIEGGVIS